MERNSAHLLLAHRTERAAAVRNTLVASLSSEEKKKSWGTGLICEGLSTTHPHPAIPAHAFTVHRSSVSEAGGSRGLVPLW
jgi:hypothetical protein